LIRWTIKTYGIKTTLSTAFIAYVIGLSLFFKSIKTSKKKKVDKNEKNFIENNTSSEEIVSK